MLSQLLELLSNKVDLGGAYQQQMDRVNRKPMSNYTMDFFAKAAHLKDADVVAYRNYVLKNGPFIDVPDLPKCNRKAAQVRQLGNRLYLKRQYKEALEKYNESICWAEGDSEDLGIGYANRSAIYYDQGEFEFSLVNIALAKKHDYPQRLMPKLLARELNCREKINNGHSKNAKPRPRLPLNVELNAKIPFLAKGIRTEQLPGYGRGIVADRNFKAGDVILHEKPMMASVSPELKYLNCNYCSMENFHCLIPCANCVSVMYCGEECLEKGQRSSHRFECGISEKLHHISYGSSRVYMGPKMFFCSLSLFKDNVDEMMTYCESHKRTGGDPLTLDYSKYDPLEEFKVFHQVKLPTKNFLFEDSFRFYAAVYYSVYINHPLVKSLFVSKPQRNFMLRYILDYMRVIGFLIIGPRVNFTNQLFSIASVCNHSCVPNTYAAHCSDQLKFVVLRPIAKGEQIFISYGPWYGEHSDFERRQSMGLFHFECLCVACDLSKRDAWIARGMAHPPIVRKHHGVVQKVMQEPTANNAAKLNALQQFIERYGHMHPREDIAAVLNMYRTMLKQVHTEEMEAILRAKADA